MPARKLQYFQIRETVHLKKAKVSGTKKTLYVKRLYNLNIELILITF